MFSKKKVSQSPIVKDASVSFTYEVSPSEQTVCGATQYGKQGSEIPLIPGSGGTAPSHHISPPTVSLPSWFKFSQKREMKKRLVTEIILRYAGPVKLPDGKDYTPSVQEIKDYGKLIRSAKLKELLEIDKFREYTLKLDILDRIKSIDKKKYAVITVFNDNNTTDTGVAHIDSRHFTRRGCTYLILNGRGYYDPEFGMVHFYYFFNAPFPIIFKKGEAPIGLPDGKLLSSTIKFEILTALANIDMSRILNIVLVISIINMLLQASQLIVSLRGFKII